MPCLNSRMVSNYVFVHIHRVRFVARSGQRGLSMYRPYPTSQRGHTYPFRPLCPHKINHKLSDQTRKLIGLNLTGGYQTNAVKSLWDSTQNALCTHCDQPDTHSHRQLECVHFQHVRDRHPEAVRLLQTFPNLLWFPVATVHAKQITYNLLKSVKVHFLMSPILCRRPTMYFIQMGAVTAPNSKIVAVPHGQLSNMLLPTRKTRR